MFPDISGLGIYHKHTQTGQYVHINSYTLWRQKTSWICSSVIRAKKICSVYYFNTEIQLIKTHASWNGYPPDVVNSIIKHALCNNDNNYKYNDNGMDAIKIYHQSKYLKQQID